MRIQTALLALLFLTVPSVAAAYGEGAFDAVDLAVSGTPYEGAAEPTVGIPWDTDSVFFHEGETTWRATFEGDTPTWTDVSPDYQVPINVDPMMHVDPDTARIWAGGLHGGCSIMMISDDDGGTWTPAGNACSGSDFDHQSIGSGPAFGAEVGAPDSPGDHHAYYCGQGGTISCARSTDGGQTWAPFTQEETRCGGFHGHIRVSRATGTMAVPVPGCDGEVGMLLMEEDPAVATQSPPLVARTIPDSEEWVGGFDPSLQFSRDNGWLYYGHASENGIHIAMSKDEGATWEPLGGGMGTNASHYLDVGQFHDPPILAGTFADVQAGDDDRVAFTFIGLEATGDPTIDEHLRTPAIYSCYNKGAAGGDGQAWEDTGGFPINQSDMVWNYYAAMSYDAGDTWRVTKISDDPVQRGGVYDSVTDGSGGCRNLLDFNDMDIDSTGRVHIGYADGCIGDCETTEEPVSPVTCGALSSPDCTPVDGTDGYRASEERLFRQTDGNGLFAAHDTAPPTPVVEAPDQDGDGIPDTEDDDIDGDGVPNDEDPEPTVAGDKDTPAAGALFAITALGVALVLRRRP